MKDTLEVELKIFDGTNQVVIACAETGRQIGMQTSTIIESEVDGLTMATVTFAIPPRKLIK